MATSAKKEETCGYAGHYHLYMTIVANKQDKANNKTNVTVKMYAKSDSDTYHAYDLASKNAVKMNVNGKQVVNTSIYMDFREQKTVKLASWTGDIAHDADGKKYLECSGSFTFAGSKWLSGGNIACSINLDSIPRATKPGLSKTLVSLGDDIVIKISPAVSTWTHNLYYRIGSGEWARIDTGIKNDYNWTVPTEIANSYPSSTSGTITIGLNTYNNGVQIGNTQTVNLDITIPETITPIVTDIRISEGVKNLELFGAGFIQNKSKLVVSADVTEAYGSSIKTYKYIIGTGTYIGMSKTYTMQDEIRDSGDVHVTVIATDNRGRSGKKTVKATVAQYNVPSVTLFECTRCGIAGTVNNNGKYIKVSAKFSISSLNGDNENRYSVEYCRTGQEWLTLMSGTAYEYDGAYVSQDAILNTDESYQVRITIADSFTRTIFTKDIGEATRILSLIMKKCAMAVGKIAELANTFEIDMDTIFQKKATFNDEVKIQKNVTAAGQIREYGTALEERYNPIIPNQLSTQKWTSVENGVNANLISFTLGAGVWIVSISVKFGYTSNAGRRAAILSTNSDASAWSAVSNFWQCTSAPAAGAATDIKFSGVLTRQEDTTYYIHAFQNSGKDMNNNVCVSYTAIKLK